MEGVRAGPVALDSSQPSQELGSQGLEHSMYCAILLPFSEAFLPFLLNQSMQKLLTMSLEIEVH